MLLHQRTQAPLSPAKAGPPGCPLSQMWSTSRDTAAGGTLLSTHRWLCSTCAMSDRGRVGRRSLFILYSALTNNGKDAVGRGGP